MPKVVIVTARKEYKCSLQWWELSSSEYVQRTQGLIYNFQDYETPDEIIQELEDIKTTMEDNLENIPENLRETSTSGEILQEYITNLEECIYGLEDIDTEDNECWRNDYLEMMESTL